MILSKKISIPSDFSKKISVLLEQRIVLASIRKNPHLNRYNNPYINSSKDEMLKRVKIDGLQLLFCSKELKDNYDVALSAVKNNGFAYRFVSKRLKDNKAIVKAAVNQNGLVLEFTGSKHRKDIDTLFTATANNHHAFYLGAPYEQNRPMICLKLTNYVEDKKRRYTCSRNLFNLIILGSIQKKSSLYRLNVGRIPIFLHRILEYTGVKEGRKWEKIISVLSCLKKMT